MKRELVTCEYAMERMRNVSNDGEIYFNAIGV